MSRLINHVRALASVALLGVLASCAGHSSPPAYQPVTASASATNDAPADDTLGSQPSASPVALPKATAAPPSGDLPPQPDPVAQPKLLGRDCNTTSWTWPFCDIPKPSIPHFKVPGGRPDLTPKDSAWCRNAYIKGGGNSGWTYWILTQNTKYNLRFWPDYYSRYYEAIYWDGRAWQWLPVSSSYPNVIMGQRVYCDA